MNAVSRREAVRVRDRRPRAHERRRRSPRRERKLRNLYVRLLIKTLTGSVIRDPSMAPWQEGVVDPELRRTGRDWPSLAHTMVGVERLTSLAALVQACLDEGVPGHFIETGVWRGGSCILMRGVLAAAGGSLDDIVKLTILLVDLGDFAKVNEIMAGAFNEPYPARSTYQVAALPRGSRIEVEAVAVLSASESIASKQTGWLETFDANKAA